METAQWQFASSRSGITADPSWPGDTDSCVAKGHVRIVDRVVERREQMYQAALGLRLKGIVAKRLASPRTGRVSVRATG